MALCTQADIEKLLQITFGNNPEAVVTYLIEGAQALIESYVSQSLEADTGIVDTLDGPGTTTLWLTRWPVTAITTLTEDGEALTEGTDFMLYPGWGRLVRVTDSGGHPRFWSVKRQAVVVTYDAGYATVPNDIRDVCASLAAAAFQAGAGFAAASDGSSAGVAAEQIDDYRVEFDDGTLNVASRALRLEDHHREILDRYRRMVLV